MLCEQRLLHPGRAACRTSDSYTQCRKHGSIHVDGHCRRRLAVALVFELKPSGRHLGHHLVRGSALGAASLALEVSHAHDAGFR